MRFMVLCSSRPDPGPHCRSTAHAAAAGASFSAKYSRMCLPSTQGWWRAERARAVCWRTRAQERARWRPARRGGVWGVGHALELPVGDTNLLDDVAVGVLHEEVGRCTLRVGHLHVRVLGHLGLRKLRDGRVVPDASAAHVEHRAREHDARAVSLVLAAALALADERIALSHKLAQLAARGAQQRRAEAERAALGLVGLVGPCGPCAHEERD